MNLQFTNSNWFGFILAIYDALILVGAGFATTSLFEKLVRFSVPKPFRLLLGVGLFPVFVSYYGFFGLGRIPFLTNALGAGFGIFGLLVILDVRAKFLSLAFLRRHWVLFTIPLFALGTTLVARCCYLS